MTVPTEEGFVVKWRKVLLCVIAICIALLFIIGKTRGSKTVIPITVETLAEPARKENFEDTVADANDIVRGKVIEILGEERIPSYLLEEYEDSEDVPLNQRQVYTVYTIKVSEVYKGNANPGDELKYQHMGGETERLIHKVTPSQKRLTVDTEYVFLLNEKGYAVGFDQGIYAVFGDNLSGAFPITFEMLEELE